MRVSSFFAAALCFSLPAVAQTKVCMGGNLDALSASERHSCEDQVRLVQKSAVPSDWHYVVVCGEDGWKDYAAFSSAQVLDAEADTDVATKTIFVRGTRLASLEASNRIIAQALHPMDAGAIQVAAK